MLFEKKNPHKFNIANPFGGAVFFQQVFVLNYFIYLFKSLVNFCLNVFLTVKLRFE